VTPTEYADFELACWEQALREQRQAEDHLNAARQKGLTRRVLELMPQVHALRLRADLLLAEAVTVKCEFSDQRLVTAWVSTTQSHGLDDAGGE
jgi:serine protease inhibitor ecotin